MSDALAFGPAPKPRFGFFKKHRIVTWCMAFTLTVTSAAFAAWVVSNTLTTQQNSKAEIGSASVLANITTTLPTDAEVIATCPAPDPTVPATANCILTLKVNNASGVDAILTQLRWSTNGSVTVSHSDGVCAGTYTALGPGGPVVGTANFLVGGSDGGPGSTVITYGGLSKPVPQGVSLIEVPNAFGVNPNGADGNACANSAVSFDSGQALHSVTFMAAQVLPGELTLTLPFNDLLVLEGKNLQPSSEVTGFARLVDLGGIVQTQQLQVAADGTISQEFHEANCGPHEVEFWATGTGRSGEALESNHVTCQQVPGA
jgi:hypothetical protein